MSKGNRPPQTEKQLAASRQPHGGDRLVAVLPPSVPRNRWIIEHLEPILHTLEE
ncbi:MAG: hypothetical protein Q4D38_12495 [Planctomycetia bacterium]|nr:hypothetical protein [Planctomycetia bacterium]